MSGSDINIDHPNPALGSILLLRAVGSTDGDFLRGLTTQLIFHPDRKAPNSAVRGYEVCRMRRLRGQLRRSPARMWAERSAHRPMPVWTCPAFVESVFDSAACRPS